MADFLKDLFGSEKLSFDEFVNKVKEKGFKLADLSKGEYVAKGKYDDAIKERDDARNTAKDWKQKYDEQVEILDGDEGLKKQIETLKSELQKAQDELAKKTEIITKRERMDAALEKVKGDKKLAKILMIEASERVSDKLDFAAAMDEVIKEDPETYAIDQQDDQGGKGGIKVKTPGASNQNSKENSGDSVDNILRASMGLPVEPAK